jgi:hypothetical protein
VPGKLGLPYIGTIRSGREQNVCSDCVRKEEGVGMSTDTWLQKSSLAMTTLLVACLFRLTPAVAQVSNCKLLGNPQVDPALVSLAMRAGRLSFRIGRDFCEVTLRSGSRGVHLPNDFGSFADTCSHGFSSGVLTLDGNAADPAAHGCIFAGQAPDVVSVNLKPGEVRSWRTNLKRVRLRRGVTACTRSTSLLKAHLALAQIW